MNHHSEETTSEGLTIIKLIFQNRIDVASEVFQQTPLQHLTEIDRKEILQYASLSLDSDSLAIAFPGLTEANEQSMTVGDNVELSQHDSKQLLLPMTAPSSTGVAAVVESTILTEVYECDYERNCTPLYKAIETAKEEDEYESILDFLETGVWNGPFEGIGGPAPMEQVKTWVTRLDKSDETKVKWSQLPLHLAIVCGEPAQIVASLLELYREAVQRQTNEGLYPLHLACNNNLSEIVVLRLLELYPEAVQRQTNEGLYPLHLACNNNQSEIVVLQLVELYPEAVQHQTNEGLYPLHLACNNNQSEIVVLQLVELYPEAVQHQTNEGLYPLHLARNNNQSETVVQRLVELYPQALQHAALA